MTWYRFYADHGPGHQSHHDVWEWIDGYEPSPDDLEEIWRGHMSGYEWPIGGWEQKVPPETDARRLYRDYCRRAAHYLRAAANLNPATDAEVKDALRHIDAYRLLVSVNVPRR